MSKGQIWITAISGPQAFLLLIIAFLIFGIYFFALGGAEPADHVMTAEGFGIGHEVYAILQFTYEGQTFAEQIIEHHEWPVEMYDIMQAMVNESSYNYLTVDAMNAEGFEEMQLDAAHYMTTWTHEFLTPAESANINYDNKYPQTAKPTQRATLPTKDPTKQILVQLCDRLEDCI